MILSKHSENPVVTMKRFRQITALIVGLLMIIALPACTMGNDRYRVAAVLKEQTLGVGFRVGDKAGDIVVAALQELQYSGRIREISLRWFGQDISLLEGVPNAIEALGLEIEERTFIVGYDPGRLPFSGLDSAGNPIGFDIELAYEVCNKLGWNVRYLAIDMANAELELRSGNVDGVWGGFALENVRNIATSPPLMRNTIVLASLTGSQVRNIRSLRGRTLTLSQNHYFNAALQQNPNLQANAEFIILVPGGTQEVFRELNSGASDAIITDLAALNFFR